MHKDEIIFEKAYGTYTYDYKADSINKESIFDLASVTKVAATTVSLMKLYDDGKLDINANLGTYLPELKGTNKYFIKIKDVLLHQAGLIPFIRFYLETINPLTKLPDPKYYASEKSDSFNIRVADKMYLKSDFRENIWQTIHASTIAAKGKYAYSDLDFLYLGKVVEAISGTQLDEFAATNFYKKMGMTSTGFSPLNFFPRTRTVPTEVDNYFRNQLVWGDVHDEGAALLGGVVGHAGLFSDAKDLSVLFNMLKNRGTYQGQQIIKPETIDLFNTYYNKDSRRGLGFDKPDPENFTKDESYPCFWASAQTFGHTGFTGTCVWVDPENDLVYIFLSNRVYPSRDGKAFTQLAIRSRIQDVFYQYILQ